MKIISLSLILLSLLATAVFGKVRVEINSKTVGQVGSELYGINLWRIWDPQVATNEAYQKALRSLGCEVIRIHNAGMYAVGKPTSWIDPDAKTWDQKKIALILGSLKGAFPKRLLTIKMWPPWMDEDKDGRLDAGREKDFAAFCADLVKIANTENLAAIGWWEILNELDLHKAYNGDLSSLNEAVTLAAEAMKKADPSIKVTGNAWAWVMQKGTMPFVNGSPSACDFFSWHSYTSIDGKMEFDEILDRVPRMLRGGSQAAAQVPVKEFWLDEWNMFGNWEADKEKKIMASPAAAVYDLMVYKTFAENTTGLILCGWNECDGIYGKIATDYTVRPTGILMGELNKSFRGKILSSEASEKSVFAYAVQNAQGRLSLAIANRATESQDLEIALSGLKWPSDAKALVIGDKETPFTSGTAVSIPARSVLLIR